MVQRASAPTLFVRRAQPASVAHGGHTIQRWSYASSLASRAWNTIGTYSHPVRLGVGALGVVGGATLGLTVGGVALGAAGATLIANSLWDTWENWPTTERIGRVPDWALSADNDRGEYRVAKIRDVELTAVESHVEAISGGRVRPIGSIEFDEKTIHVDRRRGHEMVYGARDVRVRSIRIGRGRRPTRYDPDQGDHTVAWTLITHSLEALAGGSVAEAITEILRCSEALAAVPNQTRSCLGALREIQRVEGDILQLALTTDRWNYLLSRYVDIDLTAQQLGIESTYKRRGNKTTAVKRESDAIRTMIEAEEDFLYRGASAHSTRAIAEAAEGLLDVGFNASLGGDNYAYAVADWLRALHRAFPSVMRNGTAAAAICAQVLDRDVARTYRPRDDVDTVRAWLIDLGLRRYAGF